MYKFICTHNASDNEIIVMIKVKLNIILKGLSIIFNFTSHHCQSQLWINVYRQLSFEHLSFLFYAISFFVVVVLSLVNLVSKKNGWLDPMLNFD